MEWFNIFGLCIMVVVMVPNIIFAVKCKYSFENKYNNKVVEVMEQIGRYGCFCFMIFNVPGTFSGWRSKESFVLYIIINAVLVAIYCIIWVLCWEKKGVFKALALSVIPSVIFLFSGFAIKSVLLLISALLFTPSHIFISCKNA